VYLGGATASEEAEVRRWLAEAVAILGSKAFASNLGSLDKSYSRVWMSSWEGYRKPSELASILQLKDPLKRGEWWVPAPLALVGGAYRKPGAANGYSSQSNDKAFVSWSGYRQDGIATSAMAIGRVHYDRFVNGRNEVEKSCAINTLAHEISHTLSKQAGSNLQYILDEEDGRPRPRAGEPFASYLTGTVAQCTYLQSKGRIKAAGFDSCVAVFGVARFNSDSCDDYPDGVDLAPAKAGGGQPPHPALTTG
jgi:hypothetical protein